MLRTRLIAVLTINNGILFRTKLFTPDYRYTHNFVDGWLVDEITLLDITRPGTPPADTVSFESVVSSIASRCFVPLTVGGGVRSLDDAKRLMSLGADKIGVNSGATSRPALITEIAHVFGSQCVVLSIDSRRTDVGNEVFSDFGTTATGMTAADWAKKGVALGAGEIMLSSIERDGSLQGYDIELCKEVAAAVDVPVQICGGAGAWPHFVQGVQNGGAAAVCTTNIYHFTETSIRSAKSFMHNAGIPVRLS